WWMERVSISRSTWSNRSKKRNGKVQLYYGRVRTGKRCVHTVAYFQGELVADRRGFFEYFSLILTTPFFSYAEFIPLLKK
ncbi:hypothetical protein LB465_17555, partial [Salegentibacter sp. LM13S]|uniref:hypothetical protein n=1 Tax=Salegentibacter lacus TaxID=2873599 RepID=UPI001CCDDE91